MTPADFETARKVHYEIGRIKSIERRLAEDGERHKPLFECAVREAFPARGVHVGDKALAETIRTAERMLYTALADRLASERERLQEQLAALGIFEE